MSDNYIFAQTARLRAQNKFETNCTVRQAKQLNDFYDFVKAESGKGLFIGKYPMSDIDDSVYWYLKSLGYKFELDVTSFIVDWL
jgi:hypothetical protein